MDKTDQAPNAARVLLIIAAFIVVVAGMQAAKAIIVPLLLAAFISVICSPPLFWLKERCQRGWPSSS